jgi:2-methylcitrate dehydratase PrpD
VFKRLHPLDPRCFTRVVIRGAPRILEERHAARAPQDVLGGQYSLPFTMAVALTRDLSHPLAYNDDAVRDPLVRDLAQRIELVPLEGASHDASALWQAEVLLEQAGQTHTLLTQPYKGSARNPFTWEEACEKFQRYTASVLSPPQAAAIIETVGGLEKVADMGDVARLLSPP